MIQVLKNFANSEKAVATGALVVGATVLTALGKMSVAEWQDYTMILAGIYVAGKSAQGVAAEMSGGRKARQELDELKKSITAADADADEALEEKFGDEDE